MEYVYIDSLFLLNFIVDYFILLCSARVSGAVIKRRRIALAAALGGAYSAAVLLPGAIWLSAAPVKLAVGILMALVSFGGEARLGRCCVIFFAVSAAFGGAVWGAAMLSGGGLDGRVYVPVSLKVLFLSFALCWAGVSLAFRRMGKSAEREIGELIITMNGVTVKIRALRDTGNALFDPVSGRAVAVCDLAALSPILGGAALEPADPVSLLRAMNALPGFAGKTALIPYRAVGTKSGLLSAFRPQRAEYNGRECDILVSLSPHSLSPEGDYQAII